jgi:oxalate decarboxylase/phosphoglucose isomerase-like protein (cupin superfamily)
MTVFSAGGHARTMDFHEGDVGYVEKSMPHYIENVGDTDLLFLEVFPPTTRTSRLRSGWRILLLDSWINILGPVRTSCASPRRRKP